MSLRLGSRASQGRPDGTPAYRRSFIHHVCHLVARGYGSLDRRSISNKAEPAITGKLVDGIRGFLDSPTAPSWVGHYFVSDEHNISDEKREGKHRVRVDIEIESSRRRPRPRFQFEAKRLRRDDSKSVSSYLGKDGLGCFLTGRYAGGEEVAGMLGYVQSDTVSAWAGQIHEKLCEQRGHYQLTASCRGLQRDRPEPALEASYRSSHYRQKSDIEIYHIFLLCYE